MDSLSNVSTQKLALSLVTTGATILVSQWLLRKLQVVESKQDWHVQPPPILSRRAAAVARPRPEDGIWIYFGSQSGTAQRYSQDLQDECEQNGFSVHLMDLEDFNEEFFSLHTCVVLVVATYGEGDPTDNSVEFFKWLQDDSHPPELLNGLNFTVMGLGNREYIHFNLMGKTADARLEQLGGTRIYSAGVADELQNQDKSWEEWKAGGLWGELSKCQGQNLCDLDTACKRWSAADVLCKLPLQVELHEGEVAQVDLDPMVVEGGSDVIGKWYFHAHEVPVVQCRELRQSVDSSRGLTTKHIDFDVSAVPVAWNTADNLEVLPSNPIECVEWFAQRFGVLDRLKSNINFVRSSQNGPEVSQPFPSPCTLESALSFYCDLAAAPSKSAAKRFAAFIKDETDRDALEGLLGGDGYYEITSGKIRLSLREFFELYMNSAEIDVGVFLQLCNRQKSRAYTIATSSRENAKQIGICVGMVQEALCSFASVIDELTKHNCRPPRADDLLNELGEIATEPRDFYGACSTKLCMRTAPGSKCWIATRPAGFRLPAETTAPIVMVGAGTGVAPFHAFLREFWMEQGTRTETLLFFGCWSRNEDFIYRDEFEEAVANSPSILKEVVNAFSREQTEKVYVQHRFRERAQEIKSLSDRGAHFYVCGSVNMGASIRKELADALGGIQHVERLQSSGRFYEELW